MNEHGVAFTDRRIARDTARRFHGEVRYVDETLFALEGEIKREEAKPAWWRKIWHT